MTTILEEAASATSGSRNKAYGDPLANHTRTSRLWKEYLDTKFGTDIELSPDDVCYLNILQKMSRAMHDPNHRDTWVDIAGYARNLEMMRGPFDPPPLDEGLLDAFTPPLRDDLADDPYSMGADNLLTETFAPLEDLKLSRAARKPSGYVYLACPYTDELEGVREARVRLATDVAARLMWNGLVVYSPITHGHAIAQRLVAPYTHRFWMAQCLPFLAHADKLFVLQLPGWVESKGVDLEIRYARDHGIPVEFITEDCLHGPLFS